MNRQVSESCMDFFLAEIVETMMVGGSSDEDGRINESSFLKLEGLGYDVGFRLVERITRDRPRMEESMEAIKFLCKEFWSHLFRKQVDKLQTNHKGVFVLQDHTFRWLNRFSAESEEETKRQAIKYLVFPCGIIRGALANLGVTATVTAEIIAVPACSFSVKIR